MVQRSVTDTSSGSRDALYERRSALSRDLLGPSTSEQSGSEPKRKVFAGVRRIDQRPKESRRQRPRRTPEIALGVCLVLGGAFGAAALAGKGPATASVVAAARDLAVGDVIAAEDLVALDLGVDVARHFIAASDARELLGLNVTSPTPEGAPLSRSTITRLEPLGPGEVLAPLSVESGDVPPGIAPGDIVKVAFVPDPSLSTRTAPLQYSEQVSVWAVDPPTELRSDYVVTLRTTEKFLLESVTAGRNKIVIAPGKSEVVREP